MKRLILILAILPLLMMGQNFPNHKNNSYVNDFANVIPDDKEPIIDRKIRDFRESSSIEITVVTINSLDGESIDDYTNTLFRKWGVGKKGLNNGVMILAAIQDRKWRIEVGDGLGPWLTDGYTKSAGEKILVPNFRKKQNFEAFDGIVSNFISKLGGTNWDDRVAAFKQDQARREAEATAAQQMKAEYEAKQAAENEAAMAAFWSGFRWFMLFALVIGIFVYGYIKEKRKKERLAREEDARREKVRIMNNRNLSILHTLKSYISKMENEKQNILFHDIMDGAKNSMRAIESILIANRGTTLSQLDDIDALEEEHRRLQENISTALDTQIQLAIEVDSKIKSAIEFADGFNTIAQDTMRMIDTSERKNSNSRYGKSEWSASHAKDHVSRARGYAANIKTTFGKLQTISFPGKITNAEFVRDGILKEMTQLKSQAQNEIKSAVDYCKSINEHIDYMEKAANYVASNRNRVNTLISDAEYAVNKRDVKSSTKSKLDSVKRKALSLNTHDTGDIVSMYSALSSVINELDSVISQSKRDIRDAEEERAEAIRREKRRKEREEEDERRRRDSYSSSSSDWSSSSSSSSSSSYDSGSSSSFGGGDSGGGGSSGDW